MAETLNRFAPESVSWAADEVLNAVLGEGPRRRFSDRTVSTIGIAAADGALLIVTVDHDQQAASAERCLFMPA
jgi:hypothetical protein